MFGSIPKNLWQGWVTSDDENCVPLVCRSLLLHGYGRCVLVDVGMGEKWNDKTRRIFNIQNFSSEQTGINSNEVSDIILTHLHFDHSGGISDYDPSGTLQLCYPNATIHIQRTNIELAKNPNQRERASYLARNVDSLSKTELHLVEGSCEILPNLWVHELNGHTKGLQYVEIVDPIQPLLFPSDLLPTSHHLPTHFTMSYDMNAEKVMEEKEAFLSYALEHNAIVVFVHDSSTVAAFIGRDLKGYFSIREKIMI